jgi:pimeloyl-ACP methyl ester carboxylesterase
MVSIEPALGVSPEVAALPFGGERHDFAVGGKRTFMILPAQAAGGRPWVWYQPTFLGAHPTDPSVNPTGAVHPSDVHIWLFTSLLAAGVAVGGVEIGETYGNPTGRATQTAFYEAVAAHFGLARAVRLLPQSRGGLMHYNWAAEHPECVQRVAAIYPVTDIRSWLGLAEIARRGYGWTADEMTRRMAEHNPIERLAALAARGIPILHVHGDQDAVVPAEANTIEFARRYRALGGDIEVVIVAGEGHNRSPKIFENPRLLEFLT